MPPKLTRAPSYDVLVSNLQDERIDQARRTAIRNRLIGTGMDLDVAEPWCGAWEAEAALRGLKRDGDFWEAGKLWIDAQCAARKRPPS